MNKPYLVLPLLFALVGLPACETSAPREQASAVDNAATLVVQSQNDERQYAYFTLPNRLPVLVISDPQAKKAAVSMDVGTGSKDDPEMRQGLAHFLEHMLFLGTEKYPVAGEYQEFIATHGGSHNAYTSFENTNYFFDISAPHLDQALDRFSQFFISPLFTAKYVEREKHAVESEYRANYKNDGRRGLDVFKEVVNPEHPFAKFSVGSLDTLADSPNTKVRDDLLAFYRANYSANRMALVVLGSESTAELRAMVEQRFSQVPDHNLVQKTISEPLFAPGSLPMELLVTPQQDLRSLDMVFPVEDPQPYWQSKPIHMVADIIGHEGEGSLLQYLKDKGLADGLSAGAGLQYHGGATLNMSIRLTEAGYAARDEVVAAVFQTINRIQKEGISRQRFDEQSKISDIQFRYKDKSENIHYVMGLANSLREYPAAMVLKGPYALSEYRPDLYDQYLEQLRPDNVLITVTGPGLPAVKSSQHYQTPYALAPLAEQRLRAWQGADLNPAIVMPATNPFIPDDFTRIANASADTRPALVHEEPGLRIWRGDDQQFAAPRASLRMGLYSPLANASARDAVLLQLYASMVSDWLNPKLYPALLTGFNTRLGASRRGLELGIDGFSDKQTGILDLMLHEIQQAPLDSRRFADIKLRLERSWQNRKLRAPYEYLPGALSDALYTNHWSEDDKLAAAADLTVADLERYRAAFLADMRLDILFYGNVTEQQTSELRQRVSPLLAGSTRVARLPGVELAMLDDNSRWLYPQNLEHSDAAMMYYVQGSSDDNEQRALMGLTGQIIRTPYYNSLRTEQQLGYVVYATTTVLERMPGLSFIVQSPVADATTLVAASEKLMQQFDEIAQQMTEGEFAQHKLALASLINRPHKNLSGAAGFLWDQIQQDYTGFDRREQLTGALEQLDLPQWRQFYRDNFMPRPHRALIVTQYGAKPPAGDALKGVPVIDDVDAFKRDRLQRAYP